MNNKRRTVSLFYAIIEDNLPSVGLTTSQTKATDHFSIWSDLLFPRFLCV